jgi:outer membrane biogenesis lipoprotein LolB
MLRNQSATKDRLFFPVVIIFSFTVIYLSGCSISSGPAIKHDETQLQVVRDILDNNIEKFSTLQGRGKLVVQSPRQSFSGNAIVNIINPDSIYVRIEAILGLDVGVVFANTERFLIYSPMENLAYTGDASDTLRLKSFLGFDLTFQEMLQSLSGLAGIKNMSAAKIKLKDEELHVIGIADSIFYDYTIDTQIGLISRVEMKDFAGHMLCIEEYKRFTTIKGVRIPQMMRFTRPREMESLTIFYDRLSINQPLAAGKFYVKMPHDVLEIRL